MLLGGRGSFSVNKWRVINNKQIPFVPRYLSEALKGDVRSALIDILPIVAPLVIFLVVAPFRQYVFRQ